MEYNIRIMLGTEGGIRPVTASDIQAPCDSLREPYLKACAYGQPQWWHQVLFKGVASKEVFTKLGADCDAMVHDPLLRKSCYEGLGAITPTSVNNSPVESAQLCAATSSSKLYKLYCLSYAANIISVNLGSAEAKKVCGGLTGSAADYCNLYAENKSNLMQLSVPSELL